MVLSEVSNPCFILFTVTDLVVLTSFRLLFQMLDLRILKLSSVTTLGESRIHAPGSIKFIR